jgi:fatty-acid desaturase
MMEPVIRVDGEGANAVHGRAVLDIPKLLWNFGHIAITTLFAPLYFSWSALGMFLCLTYGSLLIGHSVGMHRMMIHRSFICPKPFEYLLVYIGTLVGVAGPFGILRVHDLRDWAQRQTAAHDYFTHRRWLLPDLLWQLAYRFEFTAPPRFQIEACKANDPVYRLLEASWQFQQIPLAVLLYYAGGWPWVIWGISARISISVIGHWTITYYCHNPGQMRWLVHGAGVQASNLPGLGFVTYGECWHNNHHAFPESAQIGLEKGQADPAYWFIAYMEKIGLARDVKRPRDAELRTDLTDLQSNSLSL